jgi:hypothetical protein
MQGASGLRFMKFKKLQEQRQLRSEKVGTSQDKYVLPGQRLILPRRSTYVHGKIVTYIPG